MQTAAKSVLWRCIRCGKQRVGWDRDTEWQRRSFCCLNCGTGEKDLELVIRQFLCRAEHLTETRDGTSPPPCLTCGAIDITEKSVKGN